jgi:D-galactarolactone cycloisomerase
VNLPAIMEVRAYALRIPRDYASARGSAGSPVELDTRQGSVYSFAKTYGTVYSNSIESTLVRISTEDGAVGWGEAQAPVLPQATQVIINELFAPLLAGRPAEPLAIYRLLYDAMRVRGHFGGFYVDAISAIDCALWDLAGKLRGLSVYRMLGGPIREKVPIYISGLAGETLEQQLADAHAHVADGYRAFKIFVSGSTSDCLRLIEHLRADFGDTIKLFVDGLWRFNEHTALELAHALASYQVEWLESPLPPEDLEGHQRLAERSPIGIAAGECYRTRYECLPWLKHRAIHLLQPDIGRTGISEGVAIAALAHSFHTPVSIHLSIALGPQVAAALHAAAVMPNLAYCEVNPHILRVAERVCDMSGYSVSPEGFSLPSSPGLGVIPAPDLIDRFAL